MRIACLLSVLLLAAAPTFAATDQDTLAKRTGKYAVELGQKEKGLCVCLDDSVFFAQAVGFMRRSVEQEGLYRFVKVQCVVQGFDLTTGELQYSAACTPFAPLAK
jgi:hypothetical protein